MKKNDDKNWFCKITLNKEKLRKIDKKIDKTSQATGIICLTIIIIIMAIITYNIITTEPNNTKPPTEQEINRTCAEHGLEGAGFSINYKEGYTKILCSKNYSQTQKTKGIEDIFNG
jgi:hypothetical protein